MHAQDTDVWHPDRGGRYSRRIFFAGLVATLGVLAAWRIDDQGFWRAVMPVGGHNRPSVPCLPDISHRTIFREGISWSLSTLTARMASAASPNSHCGTGIRPTVQRIPTASSIHSPSMRHERRSTRNWEPCNSMRELTWRLRETRGKAVPQCIMMVNGCSLKVDNRRHRVCRWFGIAAMCMRSYSPSAS